VPEMEILLRSETKAYHYKNCKRRMDVLISAGNKFRNNKKFRHEIPAYTGPF
jgi:hypothetical protein